jgi:hypothetical protein
VAKPNEISVGSSPTPRHFTIAIPAMTDRQTSRPLADTERTAEIYPGKFYALMRLSKNNHFIFVTPFGV